MKNKLPKKGSWEYREFNCMSYAIGDYEHWLHPTKKPYDVCIGGYSIYADKIREYAQNVVDNFNFDIIENPSDFPRDRKIIALRVADHQDFHFVVRKNGNWFHKMGNTPYIKRMKKEEVFGNAWCGRYNSEIVFFAERLDGKVDIRC